MIRPQEALDYHSSGRPGKLEVVPTKSCATQRDLALSYTPGVAEPCKRIASNPDEAYLYTTKGNLVAVISNGSAVLGLGNIGALAGKPVMEGKGLLFKKFADIDVFDIELNSSDPAEIIRAVQMLEPTFGGINLEDIKAPECFYVERKLRDRLKIPVFHDDQHGTAIISGAALLNAIDLAGKKLPDVRVVVSGAGASAIACTNFWVTLGVKRENVLMVDTKGVLYEGRTDGINQWKAPYVRNTARRTLADAMVGADVFVGVSQAGLLTPEMVKSMAANPVIFAMANPDPEITPQAVRHVRSDVIMATGRSDHPNQVNNVLGFPFIFRGALDVRASRINEPMKLAAVYALAELARRGEGVPLAVRMAYPNDILDFGRDYIIPKPFDSRILTYVAPAVAQAAMDSGVARRKVDVVEYVKGLEQTVGVLANL